MPSAVNVMLQLSIIQKIAPQAESGEYFQIWFFPQFEGKKWRRSEHAHASYPGLSFRKESSGTGLGHSWSLVVTRKYF